MATVLRAVVFFAGAFFAGALRAGAFFAGALRAGALRATVFFAAVFLAGAFLATVLRAVVFFAGALRAGAFFVVRFAAATTPPCISCSRSVRERPTSTMTEHVRNRTHTRGDEKRPCRSAATPGRCRRRAAHAPDGDVSVRAQRRRVDDRVVVAADTDCGTTHPKVRRDRVDGGTTLARHGPRTRSSRVKRALAARAPRRGSDRRNLARLPVARRRRTADGVEQSSEPVAETAP